MSIRLATVTVGSMLLLASSCAPSICSPDDIRSALRDFVYVGAFAVDGQSIPRHGSEFVAFPSAFRGGIRYVFHTTAKVTTEHIAIVTLPERLRATHFTIIDQPRNPGDFAIPNHGGPIWEIRFSKGGCRGRIYNRVDDSLYASRSNWPSGSQDDYILEIQN